MAKGIAGRTQGIHQADGGFQTDKAVVPLVQERLLGWNDPDVDGVAGAGAAGTFTMVPIPIPAGATITNIRVKGHVVWNAGTSATLIIGDTADPNGYWAAIDAKATDLTAEQEISFENMTEHGEVGDLIDANGLRKTYYAAASEIVAVMTLVGTAATTGQPRIIVEYTVPADMQQASVFLAT